MKVLRACLAAALVLATAPAFAQIAATDYPRKPVRVIVNVSPGGGVDTATRVVAQRLNERLGQPFIVENRPSASGNLGAAVVYGAEPDGYTLLSSSGSPLAINGWVYKNLNYNPAGFMPVSVMSRIPLVLAVRNDIPPKTAQEFIAYAKANPGKLNYASQGTGTAANLTAELFMSLTGTKLVHVPYKGTGPVLSDLIAGHVDCSFIQLSNAFELAQAGRLRILAVATSSRVNVMPNTPTLVEIGYPTLVASTWNAISAPPKTPDAIMRKLNAEINAILGEASVQSRFRDLQLIAAGGSLQETKAAIEKERSLWGAVVKTAGIQPE